MAAATTLFSTPISPHHHPISTHSFSSTKSWQPLPTKSPLILLRASSTTPTVDKQEEEEEDNTSSDQSQPINSIPIGGCQGCGKAEMERGCNGEGRIQGGIATVPGFGWWPIKAYRPCPGFVATGGRYRRQGQSMDEVAGFGSVPRKPANMTTTATATVSTETPSSEKKEGPRKFKR
ncbi:hypothetical protein HanHA300_Chr17g0636541 [Helianthus annuus]|nr:hypothetical protein HanHA300_Chr17g0636541 [Helianthus annuus]KAJ0630808.1 hypothetical protein HanLR1_Chr17g0647241 [Helianthus annuus]KAJ0634667.1 hypothetical protein HanOQP8_Chr17g0642511 [Helianthus annuus]KAJ0811273.1 hypothetical protein HanPSC8_Chr17g0748891 [Helianthus annuus]